MKPCPFCNGGASVHQTHVSELQMDHQVVCYDCGASGPVFRSDHTDEDMLVCEEAAIEGWDDRINE
jgi:transcription elongation factor Elf1